MARSIEKRIEYYLGLEYPYTVVADGDEFFVQFPDLPGCMTQVEGGEEIHSMAQEVKELWLETALQAGQRIPEPMSDEYSGKFVIRVPKSLHRELAVQARKEGMSLNSYVVYLLGANQTERKLEQMLEAITNSRKATSEDSMRESSYRFSHIESTDRDIHRRASGKRLKQTQSRSEDPREPIYNWAPEPVNFAKWKSTRLNENSVASAMG